jgi:hypothetical protein
MKESNPVIERMTSSELSKADINTVVQEKFIVLYAKAISELPVNKMQSPEGSTAPEKKPGIMARMGNMAKKFSHTLRVLPGAVEHAVAKKELSKQKLQSIIDTCGIDLHTESVRAIVNTKAFTSMIGMYTMGSIESKSDWSNVLTAKRSQIYSEIIKPQSLQVSHLKKGENFRETEEGVGGYIGEKKTGNIMRKLGQDVLRKAATGAGILLATQSFAGETKNTAADIAEAFASGSDHLKKVLKYEAPKQDDSNTKRFGFDGDIPAPLFDSPAQVDTILPRIPGLTNIMYGKYLQPNSEGTTLRVQFESWHKQKLDICNLFKTEKRDASHFYEFLKRDFRNNFTYDKRADSEKYDTKMPGYIKSCAKSFYEREKRDFDDAGISQEEIQEFFTGMTNGFSELSEVLDVKSKESEVKDQLKVATDYDNGVSSQKLATQQLEKQAWEKNPISEKEFKTLRDQFSRGKVFNAEESDYSSRLSPGQQDELKKARKEYEQKNTSTTTATEDRRGNDVFPDFNNTANTEMQDGDDVYKTIKKQSKKPNQNSVETPGQGRIDLSEIKDQNVRRWSGLRDEFFKIGVLNSMDHTDPAEAVLDLLSQRYTPDQIVSEINDDIRQIPGVRLSEQEYSQISKDAKFFVDMIAKYPDINDRNVGRTVSSPSRNAYYNNKRSAGSTGRFTAADRENDGIDHSRTTVTETTSHGAVKKGKITETQSEKYEQHFKGVDFSLLKTPPVQAREEFNSFAKFITQKKGISLQTYENHSFTNQQAGERLMNLLQAMPDHCIAQIAAGMRTGGLTSGENMSAADFRSILQSEFESLKNSGTHIAGSVTFAIKKAGDFYGNKSERVPVMGIRVGDNGEIYLGLSQRIVNGQNEQFFGIYDSTGEFVPLVDLDCMNFFLINQPDGGSFKQLTVLQHGVDTLPIYNNKVTEIYSVPEKVIERFTEYIVEPGNTTERVVVVYANQERLYFPVSIVGRMRQACSDYDDGFRRDDRRLPPKPKRYDNPDPKPKVFDGDGNSTGGKVKNSGDGDSTGGKNRFNQQNDAGNSQGGKTKGQVSHGDGNAGQKNNTIKNKFHQ